VISPELELRSGTRVRYLAADSGEWRDGTLVRSSPTGEEWLVKNRFGKYWLHVSRLRPALELGETEER
jgi:hypothetical protein